MPVNRTNEQNTYEEVEYLADPDFLACVEILDQVGPPHEVRSELKRIEIGNGFKNRKSGEAKIVFYQDECSKQLLFESTSLILEPFKRVRPGELKRKPGARPRTKYRPAPRHTGP